jgi:hypothetical protein
VPLGGWIAMETITELADWEKLPEWFTGIATVLLVVVTGLLVRATKLLARIGREEGRLRKIELTTTAWMRIRPTLSFPKLTNIADPIEIENKGKASLESIITLESFAACVNSGAYDIHTFNNISGAWFLQHFRWIEPYIKANRSKTVEHPPYDEIVNLQEHIQALRSQTLPPREKEIGMATVDQSVNHRFFDKTRMEALSDGVFAVALTLLVVDIVTTGLPKLGDIGWWHHFWPKALSFVYSFFIVGMYWVIHHNEWNALKGTTRELMWLNGIFLLFIVFIPFSAALLGSNWQLD